MPVDHGVLIETRPFNIGNGDPAQHATLHHRHDLWVENRVHITFALQSGFGLVDTAGDIDREDEFQVHRDILCRGGKTPDRDRHG